MVPRKDNIKIFLTGNKTILKETCRGNGNMNDTG